MRIKFSPSLRPAPWAGSVSGSVLTIDGLIYDVAAPNLDCPWIEGQPELIDGVWHVTLVLPHGANAPRQTRFPDPVDVTDGPIPVPPYDDPQPETVPEFAHD